MRPETRVVAALLAAIPLLILAAALGATWVLAHGGPHWVRSLFLVMCHGIPHRCFALWGTTMPLCARCVAIYAGLSVSTLFFFILTFAHVRWTGPQIRPVFFVATAAMAIDGGTQLLRLRESTNALRTATGIAFGLTFGLWVLSELERREEATFTLS